MGEWINVVAEPHRCPLPGGQQISVRGAYVGSQWRCECRQLWELTMEDMGGLVWFKAQR